MSRFERGSALPLVLWILAILMTISLGLSSLIQSRLNTTDQLFQRFRASCEAYSGMQAGLYVVLLGQLGAAELRTPAGEPWTDETRFLLDGTPVALPAFPKTATLSIQEASGFIDMGYIKPELIDGLCRYFGLGEEQRKIFIDSLRDWTDEDDFVRLNGAEREFYAPLGYQPRNEPLLTLDEVLLIRGMDASVYFKMRPFLTLYKTEGVDPNTAPFEVLMAFPGMTEEGAKTIIAYRQKNYIGDLLTLSNVSGVPLVAYESLVSFSPSRSYFFKATSKLANGSRYAIRCFVSKRYSDPRANAVLDMVGGRGANPPAKRNQLWMPFNIEFWREGIE
jgi:type II secretory pathway component PulK